MAALARAVSVSDLEAASARVGTRHGWDFTKVKAVRDHPPWDYEDVVATVGRSASAVLDIGTGGGEVLRHLIDNVGWKNVVAVDHSRPMTSVAAPNLTGLAHVVESDSAALPFEGQSFDLILDRHASFHPEEIARALRPGGTFVTQQVGRHNTQSIFDAFGWGSNWDQFAHEDPPPRRCADLASDFEQLGLTIEFVDEYEGRYAFEDLDSLVFFLKAAPMPEDFHPARHCEGVNRLLANNVSERGIETTEHRELLVARST